MPENGLVLFGDMGADNVGLDEDLGPELLDGLFREVVLLDLEFLFGQQIPDVVEILLSEVIGALDDALDLNLLS